MKYGVWNVSNPEMNAVNALVTGGFSPLTAMILASRGMKGPRDAAAYLDCSAPLPDPFLMTDMDLAAGRVGLAIDRGEKIAVFGDYDVDGVTSTALMYSYLSSKGADVIYSVPEREEGYGMSITAVDRLAAEGVKLIVADPAKIPQEV